MKGLTRGITVAYNCMIGLPECVPSPFHSFRSAQDLLTHTLPKISDARIYYFLLLPSLSVLNSALRGKLSLSIFHKRDELLLWQLVVSSRLSSLPTA